MKETKKLVRYSCSFSKIDAHRHPWSKGDKKLSDEEVNALFDKMMRIEISSLFAMMAHFYSEWKFEGDPPVIVFREDMPMPPMSITIELETEFWDSEVKMTIQEEE